MTLPTPPAQDPIQIGKYVVEALAGEGAMGAVYRARDAVLNRTVAIKVMNAAIAKDELLRQRFLREAQSAGSLQHPNVVTIYDFGEMDGYLFMAMEFVEGTDLESALSAVPPMALDDRLAVMVDTLRGLDYAHQHGIVHRDLKPANIRLTADGRAKLMDFGIAHLASQKLTQTGMIMGTTYYMAPEYISGEPVTAASDLFSMGAVLYELLTGQRPFTGETMQAIIFSVIQHDPTPPSRMVPTLPPAVDAIVARAIAKDPAARYATAREMADALQDVRDALRGVLPVHQTPPSPLPAWAPTSAQPAAPAAPTPTFASPIQVTPASRVERLHRASDLELPPSRMPFLLKLLLVVALGAGAHLGYLVAVRGLTLQQAIRSANRSGIQLVNRAFVPLGMRPIPVGPAGRSR
jgi:serine/threonine-protein kinase